MSKHIKSIVFATLLSIVCSSLLTVASTGLKGYRLKNIALDKQKNILKSVGLIDQQKSLPAATIDNLYSKYIKLMWMDSQGNIISKPADADNDLPVYFYQKEGKIISYILPLDSRGLWGKISGYLALNNDGITVSGLTIYSHSETPGLGGEIEKAWFQNNFAGKKILDNTGNFVSVGIAKGLVKDSVATDRGQNFVDGISGATMTGKFLSEGLKQTLSEYELLSQKFRQNKTQ